MEHGPDVDPAESTNMWKNLDRHRICYRTILTIIYFMVSFGIYGNYLTKGNSLVSKTSYKATDIRLERENIF